MSCRIHFHETLTSPGEANGNFFNDIITKIDPGKSEEGEKEARNRENGGGGDGVGVRNLLLSCVRVFSATCIYLCTCIYINDEKLWHLKDDIQMYTYR